MNMKSNSGMYVKVAVGIVLVLGVWWILRMRSSQKKIIVTSMPVMPADISGLDDDQLYETVPAVPDVTPTTLPKASESYSQWNTMEGYDEFSGVNFKSDLLE